MSSSGRPQRPSRFSRSWSIQQIHESSHQLASTATQHLHDYVVQGLSPLISPTQANSSSSAAHTGTTSQNTWAGEYSPNQNANPQEFVIQIEPNVAPNAAPSNPQPPVDNNNEESLDTVSLRNSPEMQALIALAEKYVPFLCILLLKVIFDHRLGIFVNCGLFITFCHGNGVLKREISRQNKWKFRSLFLAFINLVLSITVIYTLLADYKLAYALVFVPPYMSPIDIWEVLWIVSVTDFVARLITMLVKMMLVVVPMQMFAYQKRGKFYLLIEATSQMYRTILPLQHWLYYFSESYTGPSKIFGVILSATYLIFKFRHIFMKIKMWKDALFKAIQPTTYGIVPTSNEIKEAGDSCPICQDDYKFPSMLDCKHIFCEECVTMWFDRERTCPICRAQIADDPAWRDGATTYMHQLF